MWACMWVYILTFAGALMLFDVFHEGGMSDAQYFYGKPDQCRFPLFDFLAPPARLEFVYMIYFFQILGWLVMHLMKQRGLSKWESRLSNNSIH